MIVVVVYVLALMKLAELYGSNHPVQFFALLGAVVMNEGFSLWTTMRKR